MSLPTGTFQRHVCLYQNAGGARGGGVSSAQPQAPFPEHPPMLVYRSSSSGNNSAATAPPALAFIGQRVLPPAAASQGGMAINLPPLSSTVTEGEFSEHHSGSDSDMSTDGGGGGGGGGTSGRASAVEARHVLCVIQRERLDQTDKGLQRLAVFLSICDFITVLYSVFSTPWNQIFSLGVIVGLVVSNALFTWASRVDKPWVHTLVLVLLPLNAGVVFSMDTPDVLLARLMLVLAEMGVLARLRSFAEPTAYFL